MEIIGRQGLLFLGFHLGGAGQGGTFNPGNVWKTENPHGAGVPLQYSDFEDLPGIHLP